MTTRAISDMIRNRLDVVIFPIINDGYTMERVINGMAADYNHVQPWNYLKPASFLMRQRMTHPIWSLRNAQQWVGGRELFEIIDDPQVKAGKGFSMAMVMMHKDDAIASLKELVELAKQLNRVG